MINFRADRWTNIKENARLWWEGELGRPLIQIRLTGSDPGREKPVASFDSPHTGFYMSGISADNIIDSLDYQLSCCEYIGDAFPHFFINSGPGVLAAFLGSEAEVTPSTVWFHPAEEMEPGEMSFKYDPENAWLRRMLSICESAESRWKGAVQVGMTDLGGPVDVLSTFRPGEKLLIDLYDKPAEVKRLVWEIHDSWWRCYEKISECLPSNHGHTAWTPLFSENTYYMLQCDFAYMIGPQMFDEFVKPELSASCERLENAFYHLDGPGQLNHLDSLLDIKALKGIQWIPGVKAGGSPSISEWPEVYGKICESGKLMQIFGPPLNEIHHLEKIAERIDYSERMAWILDMHISEKDKAFQLLDKYGVPH